MNQASPKKTNRKYWLLAGLILLVAAGSILWLIQTQTTARSAYQTSAVKRGTLTANIGATGTIRAGHSAILVWNTNGRVQTINTGIGNKVTTDQVLASLAPDSVARNIILAEADLIIAQQNLDTLLKSNNSVAQAMQNLANAKQTVKDAQADYNFITRKRVSQELIDDTADEMDKAKAQLKQTEYIYKLFYTHRADGTTSKSLMIINLTNSRQRLADITAKYNWYTSQASPIDVEKKLAILNVAKAKQEDAQREMDRQKNGTNADDISAAKARVAAARATVNQAQIIAPFDGTITEALPQANDRVSAGQTAFRVDDLSELMVDLQISEVDINNVSVGQPVSISLEAIPNKIYTGLVSKVNQSAQAGQGGINFTVSVTLTDADELVKPGMTAAVIITVKEVNAALLMPNSAIRMLSGQRIVYVLKENQPVPVNIRLGATADENSQVLAGDLKEGDLIILNPPSITNTSTQSASPTLTETNLPATPVK